MMSSEFKKLAGSFIAPSIIVAMMFAVRIYEVIAHISLADYGILPRHVDGLRGIFFIPFLHADWEHLLSNAAPILFCGAALFYFYREIAWKVLLIVYLTSGLWLWLGGRESFHIGASNIVYGLAAFLFLSGIIRKNTSLIAVSLLIVFLYGSMIWGLLPILQKVSWEGHLFGTFAGILCAIAFRKEGLQREKYEWEDEEDDDNNELNNDTDEKSPKNSPLKIIYTYKKTEEENHGC